MVVALRLVQQRAQLLTANLNQAKSILSHKFQNKTEKVNSELLKIASKYRVNSYISFIPFSSAGNPINASDAAIYLIDFLY